jgi:hypothetical protein
MSFPSSPTNGQIAVINNITYVYSSATNSWTRQQHTFNNTGPTPPTTNLLVGDIWYNTNDDTVYRYTYDGTSYYWVDIITPTVTTSTTNLNFGVITSNTFTSNTVNTTAVYANSYYFANGSSLTTGSSVPKITSVQVTNASYVANGWQAVSNTGGYIIINGTGFVAGANVVIGTKTITGTYISSTLMQVPVPAQTNGYYTVYVVNPDGGVAINVPGLIYNDVPIFTTGATLPGAVNGSSVSIQLFATDSQSLTYSLASGSLPPGLTLSSSGLISGTVTGVTSATVYNFAIAVTDTYSQVTQQTFNISVSVSDTYFPYTSLLLSASTNSANTSGNTSANTVVDSSYNYNNITRVGNPGQGSFNPFGTTWSNYFDGSTGYLVTPTNTAYNLPNNSSWTLEVWVFPNSFAASQVITFFSGGTNSWTSGTGHNADFNINTSGYVSVEYANGTGTPPVITGTTALKIGSWNHIAFVYNGSAKTITSFINGVVDINVSSMATYTPPASTPKITIGRTDSSVSSPTYFFNGYISNLRIVKGTEVYTSAFTPSTIPLSVIANTTLLTCQSNRFADANTTSANIVLNGTVTVQRFNPFSSNATPYATSSNTYIGSTYFNSATSDYLTIPYNSALSLGSNDFTVEAWIYPTASIASTQHVIGSWDGSVTLSWTFNVASGNVFSFNWSTTGSYNAALIASSGNVITPNTWNHIVAVRSGSTVTVYLNGLSRGTGSISSSIYNASQPVKIGNNTNSQPFLGYVSNARVINGTALYTSNFSPTNTPLTAIANTVLLTCQSSQTVTYDANTTPNSITVGGTPRPTKSVPFSQSWAGQFNGSSAYLSIPYNSAFALTGDFTIECWLYWSSHGSYGGVVGSANPNTGSAISSGWFLDFNSTSNNLQFEGQGSVSIVSTNVIPQNQWVHIAVVRSGSTITHYLNGITNGTGTSSQSFNSASYPLYIGIDRGVTSYTGGYISNLRIINGTAVYTSNFTPANTALTAISNTVLLTCQTGSNSNTFIDNSTNKFTITANGTPSANVVSMAAPGYSPMPIVDSSTAATTYGGSYYFNGSTDTLILPQLGLYSTNFTVEAWIYITAYTAGQGGVIITGYHLGGNQTTTFILSVSATGALIVSDAGSVIGNTVPLNSWHHVAFTYTSSSTTVQLYLDGVSQGTSTFGITGASPLLYIGGDPGDNNLGSAWFNGYISNLRATKAILYSGSTFTPPTAPFNPSTNIAYSSPANTVLLLSGTNSGAYDSTMINEFINVGGVSVTSNVKYGTTSYYFNGTSSYLTSGNSNPNFAFGTGDFTIECWIYTNSSATQRIISASSGSSVPYEFALVNSSSNIYLDFYDGTTDITTGSNYVPQNQWVHLAVTRQSSAVKLFINGAVSGTGSTSVSLNATGTLTIGRYSSSALNYFSGNIQDLRITKGIARYTAAFTPPIQSFIAQ